MEQCGGSNKYTRRKLRRRRRIRKVPGFSNTVAGQYSEPKIRKQLGPLGHSRSYLIEILNAPAAAAAGRFSGKIHKIAPKWVIEALQ